MVEALDGVAEIRDQLGDLRAGDLAQDLVHRARDRLELGRHARDLGMAAGVHAQLGGCRLGVEAEIDDELAREQVPGLQLGAETLLDQPSHERVRHRTPAVPRVRRRARARSRR